MCLVQRRDMVGQPPLTLGQPAAQACVIRSGRLLRDIEAGTEVGSDPLPIPRPFMNVQDELT